MIQTKLTGPRMCIEVADAMRGFAVAAIVLLHSIEHFNFYSFPPTDTQSAWLNFTDKAIWDGLFFAFGGKAYAIFALLFGFSFHIMYSNQLRKGKDFRLRFCWRMILLFVLGNVNACFFTGEVLVLYSLVGFILPLVCKFSNRMLLIFAILFILQPVEWCKLVVALFNPDASAPEPLSGKYWTVAYPVQGGGNFWETLKMNLYVGQMASLTWAWENARMFQTAALFMLGMLAGRKELFLDMPGNRRIWGRILACALLAFFPLYGISNMLPRFIKNPAVLTPLALIVSSLHKFAFMLILVTGVLFAFYTMRLSKLLRGLMPYGRMSLTNYITQSIVGSFIFYHWGLSLHDDLGITASVGVGILILIVQIMFCNWWMSRHTHGPLEMLWRKATWIGSGNK